MGTDRKMLNFNKTTVIDSNLKDKYATVQNTSYQECTHGTSEKTFMQAGLKRTIRIFSIFFIYILEYKYLTDPLFSTQSQLHSKNS